MSNQYAKRDHRALGEHYLRHVSAMTGEGLHAKSDIAAELAWRDAEIERLRSGLRIAISAADGWYDDPRDRPCPSISDDVRKLAATEAKP
jgi:hypothetical protein